MTGLLCPACGHDSSDVKDSRAQEGGTRRRRACRCGERFSTIEVVVRDTPTVIQYGRGQGPTGWVICVRRDDDMKALLAERITAAVARVLEQ